MPRRSRSTAALILLLTVIQVLYLHANGSCGDRLVRSQDAQLREGLALANLLRSRPLDVLAAIPPDRETGPGDHYYRGLALLDLGQYHQAALAFRKTLEQSQPGGLYQGKALEEFSRLSIYLPDLPVPEGALPKGDDLPPVTALALSGYLADRGDRETALAILRKTSFRDPGEAETAGILTASLLAAAGQAEEALKIANGIESREASALSDLLTITRGYHYLRAGAHQRARDMFLVIPPDSPYAPEALLGHAWALIGMNDLQGAVIRLEELAGSHSFTEAGEKGINDLALAYRDLGLYERAGTVLDSHLRRLQEVENWLTTLGEKDLSPETDLLAIITAINNGGDPEPQALARTPPFARQWLMEVGSDPHVQRISILLSGLARVRDGADRIGDRLEKGEEMALREIRSTREEYTEARDAALRLQESRDRLGGLAREMEFSLQELGLNRFADPATEGLIKRIETLRARLLSMESSVKKAEGFSTLVGQLSQSITQSREEAQLNRIRKEAYEGLVSSRGTLREIRNTLSMLEGQTWLRVKDKAVELQTRTADRVTESQRQADRALAVVFRTQSLLEDRLRELDGLVGRIREGRQYLGTALPVDLRNLEQRLAKLRAERMITLAREKVERLREAQAKTLYTSADIEIARMNATVRSLQEAME